MDWESPAIAVLAITRQVEDKTARAGGNFLQQVQRAMNFPKDISDSGSVNWPWRTPLLQSGFKKFDYLLALIF
jgi:hypothetical protein